MQRERLVLVRDFGELRAGMIVVCRPCGWCGCAHRGILARFRESQATHFSDGRSQVAPSFEVLPSAHAGRMWISAETVAAGIVYRVVDGLESEQKTRKAEVVR